MAVLTSTTVQLFRSTWVFESFDKQGWTENIWLLANTLNGALVACQNVVPSRLQMLDPHFELAGVRISQPTVYPFPAGVARLMNIDEGPLTSGNGAFPTPTASPWNSWDALQIRFNYDQTATSIFFLRGIPGNITVNADRSVNPGADFLNRFQAWVLQLGANSFCVVGAKGVPPGTFGDMNTITPYPGGFTFKTTAATLPVVGSPVRVAGVRGMAGVNGLKQIIGVNAGLQTISCGGLTPEGSATGGTWTTYNRQATNIVNANMDHMTTRKSGRPFGLLRGRRRNVLSQPR